MSPRGLDRVFKVVPLDMKTWAEHGSPMKAREPTLHRMTFIKQSAKPNLGSSVSNAMMQPLSPLRSGKVLLWVALQVIGDGAEAPLASCIQLRCANAIA